MFGYVFPDKAELKLREFDEYRAVYCSLCFALRALGPFAKYLLNYDFVFAAMLDMAIDGETLDCSRIRCNTNPLEKVSAAEPTERMTRCAAALVVTAHHKLRDDVRDEGFFRSLAARFALLFTARAYKKSRELCEELDRTIESAMKDQRELEAREDVSLDELCEPTASSLAFMFGAFCANEQTSARLRSLGYLIGRFVYLADAADDLKADAKHGRFNPLLRKYPDAARDEKAAENAISELRSSLYLTAAQCEERYTALEIRSYKPILDNIIFLGLRHTADTLGKPKERKKQHE